MRRSSRTSCAGVLQSLQVLVSDDRRALAASWSSCRRWYRRRRSRSARPGSEPVRMSCSFGVSPRPLTVSPFFGQRRLLVDVVWSGVEVAHALRHHHALCVLPTDPCRCGCARPRPRRLRAVSCSGTRASSSPLRPPPWRARAMRIRALQPARSAPLPCLRSSRRTVMLCLLSLRRGCHASCRQDHGTKMFAAEILEKLI